MTTPETTALARYAETERGREIHYTEKEVDAALELLAIEAGRTTPTAKLLRESGMKLTSEQLRKWRENSFPRRYAQIRENLSPEIGEKIAGTAFERAQQADGVLKEYLEEASKRLADVPPEHLAKNAQALATVLDKSIDKAQLLRSRPTAIVENRSLSELVGTLAKLGVAEVVDEDEDITDAEVVEEGDRGVKAIRPDRPARERALQARKDELQCAAELKLGVIPDLKEQLATATKEPVS